MPIYEYRCGKCGTFEVMQKISEPVLRKCPTCKGKVERLVSRSSFILKGNGWYATDYANKGSTPKSESTDSPASDGAAPSSGAPSEASSTSSDSSKSSESSKSPESSKSTEPSSKSSSAKSTSD